MAEAADGFEELDRSRVIVTEFERQTWQRAMITVFGSINIDLAMPVGRLPAPGETMLCPTYEMVPGGKGANQALAAARAGADVRMVGRVGGDAMTEPALSLMRAGGVDLASIEAGKQSTGCAAVWIDGAGENAIVVASGANQEVTADQVPDEALGPEAILILQMEVRPEENWAAIRRAKASGARVMLSVAPAAPVPDEILDQIDFLLINQVEGAAVAAAAGISPGDDSELPGLLASRHDLVCVMTLGPDGVLAAGPDGVHRVPALKIEPVDTTGAGDAFAGCLAAALDGGGDLASALRFATVGAGLACTVLGAQTSLATRAAIEARLADLA
jgi:ribokinase